jgi:uncharacterized protein (TIGR00297 family)
MNPDTFTHSLLVPPWWLAALLAALFALLTARMGWLTPYGALSTFVVGLVIYGLGGGPAIVPLLAFFLSSSLLSKLGRARKARTGQYAAKGATRDSGQVWANGGAAVALVVVPAVLQHYWPVYRLEMVPLLFLSALATVNADTWATEIGGWVGQTPRSLRDWKPVSPGVSGAITLAGTLGALAGALFIPLSVLPLWRLNIVQILIVAWSGLLGSLIDSLLGASLQVQYRNLATGELTERTEVDGRVTQRARGLRWMNNDIVNFLASVGGVLCAYFLTHKVSFLFH